MEKFLVGTWEQNGGDVEDGTGWCRAGVGWCRLD